MKSAFSAVALVSLLVAGCNVVPPLDCLAGADRAGCQKDANGNYGYLYRSAMTPNGYMSVPYVPPPQVVYVAAPAPEPAFHMSSTIACNRFGTMTQCREQ